MIHICAPPSISLATKARYSSAAQISSLGASAVAGHSSVRISAGSSTLRTASESIICSGDHRKKRRSLVVCCPFLSTKRFQSVNKQAAKLCCCSSSARQTQQPSKNDSGGTSLSGGSSSNSKKTDGFGDSVLRCAHGLQHLGIPRANLG